MSEFPKKLVINQRHTDIGFLDKMGLFEPFYTLAQFTEVTRRWNSHDDLLEACEAFVEAHEKSHQLEKTDVALRLAKAAIEQATT